MQERMNPRDELKSLLAEKIRRTQTRKLDGMYPDKGALRRDLYPKHTRFFEAGKTYRERCMMAANRVGKSFGAGGYEVTLHATGLYPVWWNGRRFDQPVLIWAAGESSKTTRDTIQKILLGDFRDIGTGLIPADCIIDYTSKAGIPNAVEDIYIRHISGGVSHIGLKSYEQGAGSFMGTERHVVWLDEEPPLDVYSECLMRTMIVPGASISESETGMVISTFTPLNGISEVVSNFLEGGRLPDNGIKGGKFVLQVTWDEVPHLSEQTKKELWDNLPKHQRDARSKGIPQIGSGKIYITPEEEIEVEPFEIPRSWPRVYSIDPAFRNFTGVVWGAWDRETDTIYIYREFYKNEVLPWQAAYEIKTPHAWIPGIIDTAAKMGSQRDGTTLFSDYEKELPNLSLINKLPGSIEEGIVRVQDRLATGRLKVFKTCKNWFEEYRLYRRDKNGKVEKKQNDDLMDATRYLVLYGLDYAIIEPRDDPYESKENYTGRNPVTGY